MPVKQALTMRFLRPFVLGALLAAAFFFYTSHRDGSAASWITRDPIHITEAQAAPGLDGDEQNNVDVYKRAVPSVVNITSTVVSYDFFFGAQAQQGAGSGFVIDKEGHILTNYHVIDGARKLEVILENKKHYPATVIGADKAHDLAVIQIKAPNLQPATLGSSSGLQVGQKVLAIGNPFGIFNGTMTRGIVSSIRQVQEPDGTYIDEAIQTDAAINPGNSGGPLLNSHGEVIGITTMIASNGADQSSGIGFAIPISTAKAVLDDFAKYGRVRRPTLDIVTLPIGPDIAEQIGLPADYGVLIERVIPGGAAERAGLHGGTERAYMGNTPLMLGGDLIVKFDGQDIANAQDLAAAMNARRAGDTVTVVVFRGRKSMEFKVVLGDAKDQPQSRQS